MSCCTVIVYYKAYWIFILKYYILISENLANKEGGELFIVPSSIFLVYFHPTFYFCVGVFTVFHNENCSTCNTIIYPFLPLNVFLYFYIVIFPSCYMVFIIILFNDTLHSTDSLFHGLLYQSLLMGTFYQFVYYCYVNIFGYIIYKMHLGQFTVSGVFLFKRVWIFLRFLLYILNTLQRHFRNLGFYWRCSMYHFTIYSLTGMFKYFFCFNKASIIVTYFE